VTKERYTGKRRHRVHNRWFGPSLVVVQVEVTVPANEGETEVTIWRDATPEDIMNVSPLPPPRDPNIPARPSR
jgi:hypothetical protein